MELVEKYVQAVKEYLPEDKRSDIVRELAENIRSQMDDQAEALGRPLTTAEQEAVLKRMGNPAVVAGQFQTNPMRLAFGRELIGPVLFPIYARVLLISLPLMVLGNLLAAGLTGQTFGAVLPTVALYALVQFAIITGIFVAAQAHLTRYPDLWDPRDPLSPVMAPKNERLVSRAASLFEILLIVAVLFVIRAFPAAAPAVVVEMGLGTVWGLGYWSVYGLTLTSLVGPVIALFCPTWTVFRAAAQVVVDVLWLGVLAVFLLAGPGLMGAPANALAEAVNRWLPWMLGPVALVTLVELGFDVRKLVRLLRLQKTQA